MPTPTEIVNAMLNNDQMSQWLGIQLISVEKGNVTLQITVRKEMTNGFDIAHGGITYSISDSSLAFSANSYGTKAVSVETSISHLKPVHVGDVLTTSVEEISLSKRIGVYHIKVHNQNQILVSTLKGTMYRTDKEWTV
jgi:acyl-CoA thioesterase